MTIAGASESAVAETGVLPKQATTSIRGLIVSAFLMTVSLAVLMGVAFPLLMLGIAQVFFNHQANGSLIKNSQGQVIGSNLIGQGFSKPRYFHPRPSAAGKGYDATSSGGTNLGPTNALLLKNTIARANLIRKEDGLPRNYLLPADAVSTSASGLDPDISRAYADLQINRVARTRGLAQSAVLALVGKYSSGRDFGFLGEPRVNVLELNLALDRLKK